MLIFCIGLWDTWQVKAWYKWDLARKFGMRKVQETLQMRKTQPILHRRHQGLTHRSGTGGGGHLLADEQDVHGAQVKVVEEGKGSQPVVCRVLARVKLCTGSACRGTGIMRKGSSSVP